MRIVVVSLDFLPEVGGVQIYLYEIFKRLGKTHDVTIVTSVAGELPPESMMNKVVLNQNCTISYWRTVRRLKPERIVVGHAHPRLLLAAWLTPQQRYATVAHGNDFLAAQQRWHRPIFNYLLAGSDPLITHAQVNARRLQNLGMPNARVVYPGTDPEQFVPRACTKESSTPALLTVSRLVPRKGIDLVIEALPVLRQEWPGLRYVVIGDGPDRGRLENLAAQLGVSSAVQFLGQVDGEQLRQQYHQGDVFVMPSREIVETGSVEGFGIVYLEASACGLPVVAGRSGGAVEAVRDGETGFLVPPDDPETLAKTLHRLLADTHLRQRLGESGRRWVETEMNWDRAARQFASLLDG